MDVGHVWRIREGCEQEYVRRHAEVWPELEAIFRDLGIRSYVIYRWGRIVFSHMQVDDYERLVAEYGHDPVSVRWEAAFDQLVEYPGADPGSGWPEVLQHVWTMRPDPAGSS